MRRAGLALNEVKIVSLGLLIVALVACFPPVARAVDDAQVETSFAQFQQDWMKKLHTEGNYGEKSMRVDRAPGGDPAAFIATYDLVGEPKSHQIKKTDMKATPYVGKIVYEIMTCSAQGKTAEEARQGPFTCELKHEVTEIFRFSGGKWIY